MSNISIPGARVSVYVNGKAYGRCSHFQFTSSTPLKEVRGLDSSIPAELAPTQASCHAQMNVWRTAADGGAEGAGMAVRYEDLPAGRYFSLMLIDQGTDQILFSAGSCSVESQSWDFPQKGAVQGTLNIKAITWSNEVRPVQR